MLQATQDSAGQLQKLRSELAQKKQGMQAWLEQHKQQAAAELLSKTSANSALLSAACAEAGK